MQQTKEIQKLNPTVNVWFLDHSRWCARSNDDTLCHRSFPLTSQIHTIPLSISIIQS